jgi:DNA polymerase-4
MKQIAHVDMDAFFVSVELLYRPELRGLPVVVGAPGDQRGVVAAASYEARKYGIHSAMPSRTAKRLCPHTVFLPGNYARYEDWSKKVRAILERFTPVVQMVSIDEAYLDLTGTERLHGSPWVTVQKIQRAVREQTHLRPSGFGGQAHSTEEAHLPCSIGVGPSYVVAKVASETAKPRGLLWVPAGAEADFLAPLPVRRIPGIGPVTEKSLAEMAVRTVGELAQVERAELQQVFGEWGESLYRKARGQDAELWFVDEEQKSISHERTFDEDIGDETQLEATLSHLAGLVGQRLREGQFYARTVTLKLRYASFETLTRARTLPAPTDLDSVLYKAAVKLFRRTWDRRQKVRLLGVAASGLGARAAQPSLFDAEEEASLEKLARAADQVRNRHGTDAVRTAKSLLRKSRP